MLLGNDVIDLLAPGRAEHFEEGLDADWLRRHLTARELRRLPPDAFYAFWEMFACKEAAHKALAQAGIGTPDGAYAWLETDLERREVLHRPSGTTARVVFLRRDRDAVHCVAALGEPAPFVWGIGRLPPGEDPSGFARERLLAALESAGGLRRDQSVSLSHSGRFVAYAFSR